MLTIHVKPDFHMLLLHKVRPQLREKTSLPEAGTLCVSQCFTARGCTADSSVLFIVASVVCLEEMSHVWSREDRIASVSARLPRCG